LDGDPEKQGKQHMQIKHSQQDIFMPKKFSTHKMFVRKHKNGIPLRYQKAIKRKITENKTKDK
jgi:hypothetical protein